MSIEETYRRRIYHAILFNRLDRSRSTIIPRHTAKHLNDQVILIDHPQNKRRPIFLKTKALLEILRKMLAARFTHVHVFRGPVFQWNQKALMDFSSSTDTSSSIHHQEIEFTVIPQRSMKRC